MLIQWNVKFLGEQVLWIMIAAAFYLYRPNRVNYTSAKVFLIWTIIDLINYVHNYKMINYGPVYLWLAAFWLLIFYGKVIGKYIWKTLHPE